MSNVKLTGLQKNVLAPKEVGMDTGTIPLSIRVNQALLVCFLWPTALLCSVTGLTGARVHVY